MVHVHDNTFDTVPRRDEPGSRLAYRIDRVAPAHPYRDKARDPRSYRLGIHLEHTRQLSGRGTLVDDRCSLSIVAPVEGPIQIGLPRRRFSGLGSHLESSEHLSTYVVNQCFDSTTSGKAGLVLAVIPDGYQRPDR